MLTIDHFTARYHLAAGAASPAAVRARLDRLARDRLPAALDGRLRPPAADAGAVYRVRQVDVNLWVDLARLSDAQIARQWSTLILRAVTEALARGGPDVVARYDDEAHFLASFLADLETGQAWSRWEYDEFRPLRSLTIGQAAAHLLAERAALLPRIARRLAASRRLEPLLRRLGPAEVALVWERGLGFGPALDVPMPPDRRDAALKALSMVTPEPGGDAAASRNLLRFYLAGVAAAPPLAGRQDFAALCLQLAQLGRLWEARPAPWLWRALRAGEIDGPIALAPLLAGLPPALERVRVWLTTALTTPAGREALARLVPVAVPSAAAEPAPAAASKVARLTTNFAGLALLLPALREWGVADWPGVGRPGIYQILLAVPPPELAPLLWGDGAAAWLAGIPEADAPRLREADLPWPTSQPANQPTNEPAFLAHRATRLFARGLRGFADASPAYLAEQFLLQPGTFTMTDDVLEVALRRAPLGVVLQMAGRTGDQGPVPWLDDRRLVVRVPV